MKTLLGLAIFLSVSICAPGQDAKPVSEKNSFVIRGTPLFIVDGIKKTKLDINPGNIEKMEVLKHEVAIALYGDEGRNGVIIVTTKRRTFQKSK